MKYKLGFVNDIKNFEHDFFYKEELKAVFEKHGMWQLFEEKIEHNRIYRWTPREVFAALEDRL